MRDDLKVLAQRELATSPDPEPKVLALIALGHVEISALLERLRAPVA